MNIIVLLGQKPLQKPLNTGSSVATAAQQLIDRRQRLVHKYKLYGKRKEGLMTCDQRRFLYGKCVADGHAFVWPIFLPILKLNGTLLEGDVRFTPHFEQVL